MAAQVLHVGRTRVTHSLIHAFTCTCDSCACIFWLIAESENSPVSWVHDDLYNNLTYAPVATQYLASLYWTVVTFSTVGYGDLTPGTRGEVCVCVCVHSIGPHSTYATQRAFTIGFQLVSLAIMAYAVANVVSWLQAAEVKRTQMGDKLAFVKQYARYRRLDPSLAADLLRFFRFQGFNSTHQAEDAELLKDLTPSLRAEVAEHFRDTLLRKWDLAQQCERVFLTALVMRLKRELKCVVGWLRGAARAHASVYRVREEADSESGGEGKEGALTGHTVPGGIRVRAGSGGQKDVHHVQRTRASGQGQCRER